jgi:hypothetical protein
MVKEVATSKADSVTNFREKKFPFYFLRASPHAEKGH